MAPNLKNLDLNLLVIFEAIYSTGNISRAAERLAMSQPAVSNALARLRIAMDDPLFSRVPHGVESTVKAREMIGPVREALQLIGRQVSAGEDIDLATYKRQFRIMIVDTLEPIMMPPILRTLCTTALGINIDCVQGHPLFYEDIKSGTIDLACFAYPPDVTDLVVKPLAAADAVAITRRNHPAIKKPLDLETFERIPQVALNRALRGMTHIDKSLVAQESKRRIVYGASKFWSIPPLVERTDMIGMVPRQFAKETSKNYDIDIHEVPTEIAEQHSYIIWHVSSEHDAGHRWLRESLMQTLLAD